MLLRFAYFASAFHDVSHTFPYTTNVLKWGKDCSASAATCKGKTDETYIPTRMVWSGTATSTECGSVYTGLEPSSLDCFNKLSKMKILKPTLPN